MSSIAITSSNPFTISSRKIAAMTDDGMVRPRSSPASKRSWPGLYPGLGSPFFFSLRTGFLIQGARELIGPANNGPHLLAAILAATVDRWRIAAKDWHVRTRPRGQMRRRNQPARPGQNADLARPAVMAV